MNAMTWLTDSNGNRCSVEYFGSTEAAQAALDGLKNCRNCTNCRDCNDCSYCSDCSDCSGCRGCSYCSDCSDCRGCSGCNDCSGCSDCNDCSGCSYCSGCSDCNDCSGCSYCNDCSGCSYCSGCSDCNDCSGCSYCNDCSGKKGEQGNFTPPIIPIIENIDAVILDACSAPDALNMRTWHSCDTTHCRAGWVVHKAGEAGYALERFHGPALAAQLIYRESGSPINPARFYDSNNEAMTDMRKRAGVEA